MNLNSIRYNVDMKNESKYRLNEILKEKVNFREEYLMSIEIRCSRGR